MMWYWGNGVDWWGWLLMSIGMVAFWGLIIWAVWVFAAGFTRPPGNERRKHDAKRVLDERLARGEIDPDESGHLRDLMRGCEISSGDGDQRVGAGDRRQ